MSFVYSAAPHGSTGRSHAHEARGGLARRTREPDFVTELLSLGAGHDERDVGDLDTPQVDLLGRTERYAELGDRAPVELVPACDPCPELARRLQPAYRLGFGPQDRLDLLDGLRDLGGNG